MMLLRTNSVNLGKAIGLACGGLLLGPAPGLFAQSNLVVAPLVSFAANGYARGPFQPERAFYILSNAGPDTVVWRTVKSAPWFSLSEPEGELAPGEARELVLFPNSRSVELPADDYEGSLVWVNQTHGESREISVRLSVVLPGPAVLEEEEVVLRDALELSYTGVPGTTFSLESTTGLQDWSVLSTNVFTERAETYRAQLETAGRRYFRVVSFGEDAIPARLSWAGVTELDPLRYRVEGDAGGTYLVETSTNGLDWIPALTNQVPAEGFFMFTNAAAGGDGSFSVRAAGLDVFPTPTLHHVLVTGQSLAVGASGNPALSTEPSAVHYRFASLGSNVFLNPLREVGAETIMSAAAAQVSLLTNGHRLLMSNAGVASAGYEQLRRGTEAYDLGLRQFRDAATPLSSRLLGYRPSAIFVVHGEADHLDPDYDLNVRQWQADYEKDVGNVTGYDAAIPMFHSQVSSWPRFGGAAGSATTVGAFELLRESIAHPDRTILVCPKYMFTYADGIHLTNRSYRWLGEYYGKVYRRVLVEGQSWSPLRPVAIGRTNNIVTARFHVPVPPLVLDTELVSNPGRFGFEYWNDSGAPPPIIAVRLAGPDTVEMAIAGLPSNVEERLRYAYTGVPGSWAGPETGPRGNLRDSDPEPSAHGHTLYNWCVHFDEPIAAAH